MKQFMDQDFLLTTETAKVLYHNYAKELPIVDYHCHISPKEIAEDRHFNNITEVWLGGDHYKWRQMRSNGIEEEYVTGKASDRDKFQKWAQTLQRAIGNPLYHWSHLELQRYFDYNGVLNKSTWEDVWELANEKLRQPDMSVRNIIKRSNVKVICTTDSPIDDLMWHKMIAQDESFDVKVLPTFRPDKAVHIEKSDFIEFIKELSNISQLPITNYNTMCKALQNRIDYFAEAGCLVADHSLPYVMYQPTSEAAVEEIFQKRLGGASLDETQLMQYKTSIMLFFGREYHKRNWALQLHFNSLRDNNTNMFKLLGPDTGYDCINNEGSAAQLTGYLNALQSTDQLPKTILYSLNPNDNALIGTVLGCFQDSSAIGKIQHGSAWWFNDHKLGMTEQLQSLANLGLLSNFIGMLTDSRSFLSYTRHEYFRRILCDIIGNWVENGEYPYDLEALGEIVQDISYNNAIRYFGFI
ncbi:glucuronate isomerase [Mobilitalea sibirica]|uniref:Uronate isomerase n=1 Tax=Mobilitalea sibirica TaxID=1462919 RepID=A0A8J7KWJ1_9FIRM|nr:glucuronate isomerase [Mobilitalea sibirica]MBH1940512.1 glucuronate isomerase [Mobilitalea sibirica]